MCFTPPSFPTSLIGSGNESWLTLKQIYTLRPGTSERHTMSQLHIVCSCREILVISRLKIPCKAVGLAGVCISDGEPPHHHNHLTSAAPQWIKGKIFMKSEPDASEN